mmetsp:Transcript_18069/g.45489  ORF Transcript_18069/g.45489 Transcript_18069/m.45489 type:complete len:240 (+) Transcript_18069:1051-1770(+)
MYAAACCASWYVAYQDHHMLPYLCHYTRAMDRPRLAHSTSASSCCHPASLCSAPLECPAALVMRCWRWQGCCGQRSGLAARSVYCAAGAEPAGSAELPTAASPRCFSSTTTTVMLSQPTPRASLGSLARHASSSAHEAWLGVMPWSNRWLMKSTASWFDITSQTPSHARIKKRSSGVRAIFLTSGCAVIIWSFAGSSVLPLYFRSPMARLRFRLPLTLHTPPISLRNPPAAMMRDLSLS